MPARQPLRAARRSPRLPPALPGHARARASARGSPSSRSSIDVYDRTQLGRVGQRAADRRVPARGRRRAARSGRSRPAAAARLIVASDVVRAGVFCVAAVRRQRRATIVALAAVAGIATGFFRPAVYAGLPNLVARRRPAARERRCSRRVENVTLGDRPARSAARSSPPRARTSPTGSTRRRSPSRRCCSLRIRGRVPGGAGGERRPLARPRRGLRARAPLARAARPCSVAWSLVDARRTPAINVAEVVLAKDVFDAGDVGFGLLVGGRGRRAGRSGASLGGRAARARGRSRAVYARAIAALMALGVGGGRGLAERLGRRCVLSSSPASATASPSSATRCSSSAARPTGCAGASSRSS